MGSVDGAGLRRWVVRGWRARATWVVGILALALGACIVEPQDEGGDGDGGPDSLRLISGSPVAGTLAPGELDTYWFEAAVGHSVVVRIVDPFDGEFRPLLQVVRPDGGVEVLQWGEHLAEGRFSVAQAGTYRVVIDNYLYTQTTIADYQLYFALADGTVGGGVMSPGAASDGALAKGALGVHRFTASAGQGVHLRIADVEGSSFAVGFTVYRPDGSIEASAEAGEVAGYAFGAPQSGTYTVVVYDASSSLRTGRYRLYYVLAPGANAGGVLTPGVVTVGTLEKGELESFTFTAAAGQGVHLRVADVADGFLEPALRVYRPDGTEQGSDVGSAVAAYAFSAPQAGTYTVVVRDGSFSADEMGAFRLYYVLAPGANAGGTLMPGGAVSGTLDRGELESFTFAAAAGQGVHLRVADVADGFLEPALRVYRPDGTEQGSDVGSAVAAYAFSAPQAGTYTVVIYDASLNLDETGAFRLYYVLAPGANAGGTLMPGGAVSGTLDRGELESFTFTAALGQGVHLRVADVADGFLEPALRVYRPDGSEQGANAGSAVAGYVFSAPQAGTYTVVVYDGSLLSDETGAFRLYYVLAPGANASGALTPGRSAPGILERGELESFTFTAAAGQGVHLRVAEIADGFLAPALRVYRPDGSEHGMDWGSAVADYAFSATQAGTYTVVVYDASLNSDETGAFRLHYVLAPGANASGAIQIGGAVQGIVDKGELDSFTFTATAGQALTVQVSELVTSSFGPGFSLYRPDGGFVVARWGSSSASWQFLAPQSGTYTLVVYDGSGDFSASGSFQVTLTAN